MFGEYVKLLTDTAKVGLETFQTGLANIRFKIRIVSVNISRYIIEIT